MVMFEAEASQSQQVYCLESLITPKIWLSQASEIQPASCIGYRKTKTGRKYARNSKKFSLEAVMTFFENFRKTLGATNNRISTFKKPLGFKNNQ